MDQKPLREELAFYEEQKPTLLVKAEGQYAVIKGRQIIGIYPTQADAYREGFRKFVKEPFLVKRIVDKEPTEQVPLLALQMQRAHI